MYKISYVSGDNFSIGKALNQTIDEINRLDGTIKHIVQSQSTNANGLTIVTVTIIYTR